MSYVSRSLSHGEEILLRAHLHWCCFLGEWLFTLLTAGVACILFLQFEQLSQPAQYGLTGFLALMSYWTVHKWLIILSIDMVITNRRVIYKEGLLGVTTAEILNSKIESVAIEQSVLGHIFGYADIHFSGTGTAHVTYKYVRHPARIKSELEYIISQR